MKNLLLCAMCFILCCSLSACGADVVTDIDAGKDALKNRLIYGPDFDPNADNSAYTINGELFTNLQDSDESGKPDETQQAIEQTPQIEAQQTLNPIVNIVDRTKTEGLPYDMAEEKFFEDGDNEYYFSGIYSHYVIVHYEDGSQEDIVTALNAGRATIADLDKFEVHYTTKSLGAETAKPANGTTENVTGIFDMLNELEYQPYTCDGLPEYLLTATDGTVYSINFSEKWVWRGTNEQAELSDELISQLKESKSLIAKDKPIEAQPDENISQVVGFPQDIPDKGSPPTEYPDTIIVPGFDLDEPDEPDTP